MERGNEDEPPPMIDERTLVFVLFLVGLTGLVWGVYAAYLWAWGCSS